MTPLQPVWCRGQEWVEGHCAKGRDAFRASAEQRRRLPATCTVTLARYSSVPEAKAALRRFLALAALSIFLMADGTPSDASASESEASLIVKIAKFVHWPTGTFANYPSVLRLCVVGTDAGSENIDGLAGQKLQDKVIAVAQIASPEQSVSACHILFIKKSEADRLAAVLDSAAHSPVLTISDIDGFAGQGGMVGFSRVDGKIHFEINAAASKRAGLTFGAQLLQIAALSTDERMDLRP
jgi:hypothetical protein